MRRALPAFVCVLIVSVAGLWAAPPAAPQAVVFTLTVPGAAPAVFEKCSGLGSANAIVEYRSGADPTFVQKIPGVLSVLNVTCSRALSADKSLAQWRELVEQSSAPGSAYRKDGVLALNDTPRHELARWNLHDLWPAALTVEVDEETGVAMERVQFAVERIERP